MKIFRLAFLFSVMALCSCAVFEKDSEDSVKISDVKMKSESVYATIDCFVKSNCNDCKRIEPILKRLKKEYPSIILLTYSCDADDGKELLKEKCIECNVPEGERMEVPTIFIGKKFLVNDDVTYKSLSKLILNK